MSAEKCSRHTPAPAGYIAWHIWAREMSRTHTQRRCPDCGRYAIWIQKHGADGLPRHDRRKRCSRSALRFTYTDNLGNTWCDRCGHIVAFPVRPDREQEK